MSRSSTLMVVGFFIMIFSFMGIPLRWLHVLLPIFGCLIVVIGFLMRTERVATLRNATSETPAMTTETLAASPNEISSIA